MMFARRVYPLLSRPVLKPKIWGGRNLEKLFGFELPPGENIGEAWIAADLSEGASSVANGPLAGRSLSEAVETWGEDLIGSAWRGRPTGKRFPLLVKFIDARDDLSIQVHPDEAACRAHFPKDFGKDESWIVLDARPGGAILLGFKPGVTLEKFDYLLARGRVTECLRRVPVRPGEFFRVAPGTVHTLYAGVTVLEIQEPSDSTFRIYDYGRPGADGKPRPLHLEAARKVLRFAHELPPPPEPIVTRAEWGLHTLLADIPAYRIECLDLAAPAHWRVDPRSVQVLIVLEGKTLLEAAGETLDLEPGACAILPAAVGEARATPRTPGARLALAGAGGAPLCPTGE